MKLFLVRHGETHFNEEHRIQGAGSDVELNANGKEQADRLAERLSRESVAAVYCSPLSRARETAQLIAARHGLGIRVEPGLREIEAGDLEGKKVDILGGALSEFLIRFDEGAMPKLPGGEGLEDLQTRAWEVVQRILEEQTTGTVVVVSHYFTTLAVICRALGFPLAALRRLRTMPGSLNVIEFSDLGPILKVLNDTCHLA